MSRLGSFQSSSLAPVVPSLRRWPLVAWLQAWGAVRDGLTLLEHLRGRAAGYLGQFAHHGLHLDVAVDLEQGHVSLRNRDTASLAGTAIGAASNPHDESFESCLLRERGSDGLTDLNDARTKIREIDQARDDARQKAQTRGEELARAVAEGSALPSPYAVGTRPHVPGAARSLLLLFVAALCLLIEAAQLFFPFLDAFAVDASDLTDEILRAPLLVFSAAGVALVASAILVFLTHQTLHHGRRAVSDGVARGVQRSETAFAVGLGSIVLVVSWILAGVRHGASEGALLLVSAESGQTSAATSPLLWFMLTALAPVLSAVLGSLALNHLRLRGEAQRTARAFDRDVASRYAEYQRLKMAQDLEGRAVIRLSVDRLEPAFREQRIRAEVEAKGIQRLERGAHDQRLLEQASMRMKAELELDAWEFRRAAKRAGRQALLSLAQTPAGTEGQTAEGHGLVLVDAVTAGAR